eukprot:4752637-Pleurochrysis_carterae.AAC.1
MRKKFGVRIHAFVITDFALCHTVLRRAHAPARVMHHRRNVYFVNILMYDEATALFVGNSPQRDSPGQGEYRGVLLGC